MLGKCTFIGERRIEFQIMIETSKYYQSIISAVHNRNLCEVCQKKEEEKRVQETWNLLRSVFLARICSVYTDPCRMCVPFGPVQCVPEQELEPVIRK